MSFDGLTHALVKEPGAHLIGGRKYNENEPRLAVPSCHGSDDR